MRIVLPALVAVTLLSPVAAAAQPPRQVPVDSLIYDLRNPDPVRRREAVVLIGQNKVQRAVRDVVAIASDPDPAVRRAIVATLQQLDDIGALPGLVALTADPERDIRDSAVSGVTRVYLPRETGIMPSLTKVANFLNPFSDEWADVIVEPDLAVDPTVVPALIARLQDPTDGIRIKAARSIGILRGQSAVAPLVTVMKEDRRCPARVVRVHAGGGPHAVDRVRTAIAPASTRRRSRRSRSARHRRRGRLHRRRGWPGAASRWQWSSVQRTSRRPRSTSGIDAYWSLIRGKSEVALVDGAGRRGSRPTPPRRAGAGPPACRRGRCGARPRWHVAGTAGLARMATMRSASSASPITASTAGPGSAFHGSLASR